MPEGIKKTRPAACSLKILVLWDQPGYYKMIFT